MAMTMASLYFQIDVGILFISRKRLKKVDWYKRSVVWLEANWIDVRMWCATQCYHLVNCHCLISLTCRYLSPSQTFAYLSHNELCHSAGVSLIKSDLQSCELTTALLAPKMWLQFVVMASCYRDSKT